MRILTFLFLLIIAVSLSACNTVAPTPLLMGRVVDLNTEVNQLYLDCSEGANYVVSKEGCDPELLSVQTEKFLDLSEEFISADIKQPQGYILHLETTMKYFRIAQRNANEYTRAEMISRQFFEIQKSIRGRSMDDARFYWAYFTAAHASYQFNACQYHNDCSALDQDRKLVLLLATAEGIEVSEVIEGAKAVRLRQSLQNLELVIDSIE